MNKLSSIFTWLFLIGFLLYGISIEKWSFCLQWYLLFLVVMIGVIIYNCVTQDNFSRLAKERPLLALFIGLYVTIGWPFFITERTIVDLISKEEKDESDAK